MPKSSSFTVTARGGLFNTLISECGICQGFDPASGGTSPPVISFKALWDTGATGTVITQKVVDECGLKPTGMTMVHGVNSTDMTETYLVNVLLPNGVRVVHVPVTKGNLPSGNCDVLIGMDIITKGDFSVTNKDDNTVFSFRVPSMKAVDFVKEHHAEVKREELAQHGGAKKQRKKKPKKFGKNKKK